LNGLIFAPAGWSLMSAISTGAEALTESAAVRRNVRLIWRGLLSHDRMRFGIFQSLSLNIACRCSVDLVPLRRRF
jgi:hypothetical protein